MGKDENDATLAKLNTKMDQATAHSAKLQEEIAVLQKELADLAATQSEMDKLRSEEKATYEKNKPEIEQGIEGVKIALKILREYYAADNSAHEEAAGESTGIISL